MREDTGSMYLAGEWRTDGAVDEIRNPYSGDVVGTVPRASAADVEAALAAAVDGAAAMRKQTKAEARYQDHPKGTQRCGLCANFIPPNDCRVIQGPVSDDGWCRNFRARG